MPNRFLKESITTSDTIDHLSDAEEAFFYRLIVICDDFGRFDARAPILKARLYPLRTDRISDKEIIQRLQALVDAELVYVYQQNGHVFLQIITWEAHQQIRASKSKYPDPFAPDSSCYQLITDSDQCARTRIRTRTRISVSEAEQDGADSAESGVIEDFDEDTEDETLELIAVPDMPALPTPEKLDIKDLPDDFAAFCAAYPKPVDKRAAYRKWYHLTVTMKKADRVSPGDLEKCALRYAVEVQGREAKYIKAAEVFLSLKDRWFEKYLEEPVESATPHPEFRGTVVNGAHFAEKLDPRYVAYLEEEAAREREGVRA